MEFLNLTALLECGDYQMTISNALSAPSDACTVVMGYLQENNAKTGSKKIKEEEHYKNIENSVYAVFAKIVIKNVVSSVIFLDIDGVLFHRRMDGSVKQMASQLFPSHTGPWKDEQCDIAATHLFDQNALSILKKLTLVSKNIAIVLSSSWREKQSVPKLRTIFAACFFSNLIIHKTPDRTDKEYMKGKSLVSDHSRAKEIAYWLKNHPTIKNFVILDDEDRGLSDSFSEHFVQTDAGNLLTDGDAEKARKILDN
jgi:hypothetical protein